MNIRITLWAIKVCDYGYKTWSFGSPDAWGRAELTVRRKAIQRIVSAGGVIFRSIGGVHEFALIFTGRVCGLPKGLVEPGETFEQTAVREVKEETGLDGKLVGQIGEINYAFTRDKIYYKTVHFYLLRYVGGSVDAHDHEVDEVKFVPALEALQLLTHPSERGIVAKALEMLRD